MPLFGVNLFRLLPQVNHLFVPCLDDVLHLGRIHRAWYFTHQIIIVHDLEELSNVRSEMMSSLASRPLVSDAAGCCRSSPRSSTLSIAAARKSKASTYAEHSHDMT